MSNWFDNKNVTDPKDWKEILRAIIRMRPREDYVGEVGNMIQVHGNALAITQILSFAKQLVSLWDHEFVDGELETAMRETDDLANTIAIAISENLYARKSLDIISRRKEQPITILELLLMDIDFDCMLNIYDMDTRLIYGSPHQVLNYLKYHANACSLIVLKIDAGADGIRIHCI